ncbi:MFS transporter [Alcanivorax sp. JB21]|uniref:MFS transporter n=1 Tax=Alcanivorax limicola TaxID=2874102 RepID=UPI001CBB9226|nr:MFS transporter [Alcanivorax limicola]MBZ2190479.1 MFS transporter [Alcanivorax limicola]
MSSSSPRSVLVRTELRVTGALASIFALRMFGLFMLLPVFAVYGAALPGATPFLIGVAVGAYGLMQALLQLPFGMLSDRLGRRPVILAGLLLFVLGGVVAALADSIYGVIAGRALQGAGAIAAVVMALVADVVSEQHRTRAMAGIGMSVGASFLLALVLGPILAAWLGLSGLFWFSAVLALAGIVVALVWVPDPRVRVSEPVLPLGPRLARILRDPMLLRLNAGIFVLHMVLTAMFVVVPGLLLDVGLPLARHSMLYLGVLLASVLVMIPLIIASERRGVRPVKAVAVVLLGLSMVGLALAGNQLWHFVLALFLFFSGFNLLEALLPSLVGRVAPAGTRGTALGIYSSSQFLGVFAGGALGGLLWQQAGASAVFWTGSVLVLLWLALVLTMRVPPKSDSRVVTLRDPVTSADAAARRLLDVRGVLEAMVMPETGLAVLKVDSGNLDQAALDQMADGAAQDPGSRQ